MIYDYDKDFIKQNLSLIQIAEILEDLGASANIQKEMLITETICHNLPGEGSNKLYYWDNTKLFKCFTDCGETFDIFELIIRANERKNDEEYPLYRAIGYVARKFGFAQVENEEESQVLRDWYIIKGMEASLEEEEQKNKELKVYEEQILSRLAKVKITPWLEEGIKQETIDRYEICYYPKDCQIIIPHRNINNELIGIRGRTLVKEEGDIYGKYRPAYINRQQYNHSLGFNLYGLNYNKENIKIIKKVIIFEGEKSVMLYDSIFGSDNNISVACCGSTFSMNQFNLLKDLGVEEIILAFDRQFKEIGDKEFKLHKKSLLAMAEKFKRYVGVSIMFDKFGLLDYKASPIDHGKDTFLELFRNRIII